MEPRVTESQVNKISAFLSTTYGFVPERIEAVRMGVMNQNLTFWSQNTLYLLKLYRIKSSSEVQLEVEVLESLAKLDFPSPRLVASLTGNVLETYEGQPCIVYPYIEGRPLATIPYTNAHAHAVGNIVGRLHKLTEGIKPIAKKHTWDHDVLPGLLQEQTKVIVGKGYIEFAEIQIFILDELKLIELPHALPQGITHQDAKPENVIVNGERVAALIDFDNVYYGTLLHDVTTPIIWMCFRNDRFDREMSQAILEGYEKSRTLTQKEKHSLPTALRWRLLREMFVGPYVTPIISDQIRQRTEHFKRMYKAHQNIDFL